ncbi:transmembrane 6 superfamily member 1-like isoform X1 [Corticium candelabrum]|uniref:transmembrane 6 superfamily member 1-like isoform X1 n=1 Tax=Corticium candelabrum TaxID=121492 RepID=UPI002E259875|nr:transmembrane 6 superfamily member 1-like isoform X1 [Corticium candelabrum]
MASAFRRLTVVSRTFILALLGIPTTYWFNSMKSMSNHWVIFWGSNAILAAVVLFVYLFPPTESDSPARKDPFLYAFSLFCYTALVDLCIGLELHGWISNSMLFYFKEGEPYLATSHGMMINYWDGTVHLLLYLILIDGIARRHEYRNIGLYWFGSIFNSLIVLLCGSVSGEIGTRLRASYFLNTAYVIVPLVFVTRLLQKDRHFIVKTQDKTGIWRRPLDMLFIVYFVGAIIVAFIRGYASLGSPTWISQWYLTEVEPYIADSSGFPRMQMLTYVWYFVPYYGMSIYGLLNHGRSWMLDWSMIHAGAAAQAQFSHIGSSLYSLNGSQQVPEGGALTFWLVNISLAIVPQLFAFRCFTNENFFVPSSSKASD